MSAAPFFDSLLGLSSGGGNGTLDVRRGLERVRDGVLFYVAMQIDEQPDVVESPDELAGGPCYAAFRLTEELLQKLAVATHVMAEHGLDRVDFAWEPVELDAAAGRIRDIAWNLELCEGFVSIHGARVDGGSCSVSSFNYTSLPSVAAALCSDYAEPALRIGGDSHHTPFQPPVLRLQWRAGALLQSDPDNLPSTTFEELLMARSSAFAARVREHMMREVIAGHPKPTERPAPVRMRRNSI